MAATLAFYRALGLDLAPELDKEPHAEARLRGGIRLMFDSHESLTQLDPEWTPGDPEGGGALAFACDDPADVNSTHAALVAAGYRSHKEPWDAVWGQRYAQVYDPDNRVIDLFASL
jgi:uncharacterized glyoxalase superfamily protein PhnB